LYLNSYHSRFETINPSTANAEVTTLGLTIEACSGDEDSILKAATFMVDAFWLGTDKTSRDDRARRSMSPPQYDNRSDHESKYVSCKLDPPTNKLKKQPGYGIQGQTTDSVKPSHSDNMLGPHQDVLRR